LVELQPLLLLFAVYCYLLLGWQRYFVRRSNLLLRIKRQQLLLLVIRVGWFISNLAVCALGLKRNPQLQTFDVEQMSATWEFFETVTCLIVTKADVAPHDAESLISV